MISATTTPKTAPLPFPSARDERALFEEREEIRSHYSRLILSGVKDPEAFDRCDDAYGYVASIRALKAASPHARKLSDAYWAKRRGGRR